MFWVKPVHQLFVLRVTALNVEMNQKTKLNGLGRSSRFHFVLIASWNWGLCPVNATISPFDFVWNESSTLFFLNRKLALGTVAVLMTCFLRQATWKLWRTIWTSNRELHRLLRRRWFWVPVTAPTMVPLRPKDVAPKTRSRSWLIRTRDFERNVVLKKQKRNEAFSPLTDVASGPLTDLINHTLQVYVQ